MDSPLFPWMDHLEGEETLEYAAKPRSKPKFKTALDAADLFPAGGSRSVVTTTRTGDAITVAMEHQLITGRIIETAICARDDGLAVRNFTRVLHDSEGHECRREEVDFSRGPLKLPRASYPEVLLPFVMRALPHEGRSTAWAWINDRMVARLYIEVRGMERVKVPAGSFRAREVWMYPDLNDWIALGAIVTKLAKPLLPRYHIWFETSGARRVVAFEGPYGPPGAPEVRFELSG